MKKFLNYFLGRKELVSALMVVGGITSVFSKYGCCFYIFHQPKFPDALRTEM